MNRFQYLHEVEIVELISPTKRPTRELLGKCIENGFTLHDDILSLDRTDQVPPWQHSSIIEVEVHCDDEETYGFEDGDWNVIKLKYLLAFLPFEYSTNFVDTCERISRSLGLDMHYQGTKVDCAMLRSILSKARDELTSETGEDAGSEGLAILIQSTYPRH